MPSARCECDEKSKKLHQITNDSIFCENDAEEITRFLLLMFVILFFTFKQFFI